MFERFDKDSGALVVQAREEAMRVGAPKLEAEHLLLALSRHPTWDAGRVLIQAGLDHDGLRDAINAERERSLQSVGVSVGSVALAERPLPAAHQPRWGASAKRAIERAMVIVKARGDRSIRPAHILLGTLDGEEGTVPRALATAGVDRSELVRRAEARL